MVNAWNGISIVVSHDRPKMKLSEAVPVTPEFREEFNRWMLGFFGTTNTVADGEVMHMPLQRILIMNPRTFDALKKGVK